MSEEGSASMLEGPRRPRRDRKIRLASDRLMPAVRTGLDGVQATSTAGARTVRLWDGVSGRMLRTVLALSVLALAPAVGRAAPEVGTRDLDRMGDGVFGPAPAGWLNYCLAAPARCARPVPSAHLTWDAATASTVRRVQREVNGSIRPVAEPPSRDAWVLGPIAGDCEDFALTKQAALRAAGLPAGALRLATAYTERGEYHTVLTAQTDRGTYVLDNRFADPLPLAAVPYRWIMVERPDQPFRWSRLDVPT